MAAVEKLDALVIGAGQGGVPLARALAEAGWQTALVEREHVGGTCINEGCTPSKTMIASGEVAEMARRAGEYGVRAGSVSVDLRRIVERKRGVVDEFRESSRRRLEQTANLQLMMGQARFTGPSEMEATLRDGSVRRLAAPKIILDTGGRPAIPPLPGLDRVPALTSTTIMELELLPEHLLILGGGYVGLEFAQLFRRLGSEVTIIQRSGQLLGREDPDVADEIAKILGEDGIHVRLETFAQAVEPRGAGRLQLTVTGPSGEEQLAGSHLLLAAGRQPNTADLNLPAAGVKTDERGNIPVNKWLETNVRGIYAIGDVTGEPAFTHISYDDYRILRANLLEGEDCSTEGRQIPYVVFIDPQLGRVGPTERQAREQGYRVRVAKMPMSSVARAIESGRTRGFLKALVNAEDDTILGCSFLGYEAGELLAVIQTAMRGRIPYTVLRDGIFSHPTLAESLNNLFTHFQE